MKTLILLCLFIATAFVAKAQSHISTGKYACDLVPKSLGAEKYTCPACAKIHEKKRSAKILADKKDYDSSVANAKASKINSIAKRKTEQAEVIKKNKVTELGLKMPETNGVKADAEVKSPQKTTAVKEKEIFMKGLFYGNGFKNAKTEENIISDETNASPYESTDGAFLNTCGAIQFAFPANTGIVAFKTRVRTPEPMATELSSYEYLVYDLIDVNQKRTFNSDRISFIGHLYGDWFLVGYNAFKYDSMFTEIGEVKLYNVKTKQFVDIPEKNFRNVITLVVYKGQAQLAKQNRTYLNGSYHSEKTDCYNPQDLNRTEVLMKEKLGGQDKWKAYILVRQVTALRGGKANHIIYYVNVDDKISNFTITENEFNEL